MATSAYPTITAGVGLTYAGGGTTVAPRGDFIPALWSDEIAAAFQVNLVVGATVSRMQHNGKKGDTVYIPSPTRGAASTKSALAGVTLQGNNEGSIAVYIDKHKEYSRLVEDIVGVQALPSLRQFYVSDASYAVANRMDRDVSLLWHYFNAGNTTPAAANLFETAVIGSDGSTAFNNSSAADNGAALTDTGIRKIIQTLDDNDVPMSERVLVIPPVEKKNLMGIPRFTEQAFVGEGGAGNTIRNGMVGNVYGIPVYVTTNCPFIHCNSVTNTASVTFSSTAPTGTAYVDEYGLSVNWTASTPVDTKYRACAMYHKSALVMIEQMSPRVQAQYKQEYLATLLTTDVIYGVGRLRDGGAGTNSLATAGLAIIVPA